jgi:hypothetical protein
VVRLGETATRATIAFLESDRPDRPRADDAHGDEVMARVGGAGRSLRRELDRRRVQRPDD